MIRSLYFTHGKPLDVSFPRERLTEALKNTKGLLWMDFSGEPPDECEPILKEFGFHPLAIDDALQETHTPKVNDWGNYIYIVLNALTYQEQPEDGELQSEELDVFLGRNYIVTHHDKPITSLDEVWAACQRDARHIQSGPDHLLYKISDHLVAGYMPVVEHVDRAIDEIENQIFSAPTPQTLERLFSLKRVLLSMRRVITPQREVLNKLARDDYQVIDPKDRFFFRDVYDHLVRLHDLNESMRDLVGGALDTYLSVINNRMNEVMRTLTVITTLFMPLSFVVGFFGMNFFLPNVPISTWMERPVFYLVLLLMVLTPLGMYQWMRRRMWV